MADSKIKKRTVPIKIRIIAWVAYILLNLVGRLVRIREIGAEYYRAMDRRDERYIFTLWHGRMFIPIFVQRNRGIVAMVSQHLDGEFIARAVERMGYHTVRGSSTRGGSKALREMVRMIRGGLNGAMMVDGPRGPRGEFKPGTVMLAQLSGAKLIPMTYAASKAKIFDSWDLFLLAKPFSRVVVAYGEPVQVPRHMDDADTREFIAMMEARMNSLVDLAEREVGR